MQHDHATTNGPKTLANVSNVPMSHFLTWWHAPIEGHRREGAGREQEQDQDQDQDQDEGVRERSEQRTRHQDKTRHDTTRQDKTRHDKTRQDTTRQRTNSRTQEKGGRNLAPRQRRSWCWLEKTKCKRISSYETATKYRSVSGDLTTLSAIPTPPPPLESPPPGDGVGVGDGAIGDGAVVDAVVDAVVVVIVVVVVAAAGAAGFCAGPAWSSVFPSSCSARVRFPRARFP